MRRLIIIIILIIAINTRIIIVIIIRIVTIVLMLIKMIRRRKIELIITIIIIIPFWGLATLTLTFGVGRFRGSGLGFRDPAHAISMYGVVKVLEAQQPCFNKGILFWGWLLYKGTTLNPKT